MLVSLVKRAQSRRDDAQRPSRRLLTDAKLVGQIVRRVVNRCHDSTLHKGLSRVYFFVNSQLRF